MESSPIDTTNDKQMVVEGLRSPKFYPTIFNINATNGNRRHQPLERDRLKEVKAFHKEYGNKLNNEKTKRELLKTVAEAAKHPIHMNIVLSIN